MAVRAAEVPGLEAVPKGQSEPTVPCVVRSIGAIICVLVVPLVDSSGVHSVAASATQGQWIFDLSNENKDAHGSERVRIFNISKNLVCYQWRKYIYSISFIKFRAMPSVPPMVDGRVGEESPREK